MSECPSIPTLRLAAVLIGLLALVGCGGGGSRNDSGISPPSASPTPPTLTTISQAAAFDASELPDSTCKVTTFVWPSGVSDSRVAQAFSEVSDVPGVVGRYHTGLDIGAGGVAQQAAAITQGRIAGIFNSTTHTVSGGKLVAETSPTGNARLQGVVLIKHTGEALDVYWTMYAHLDSASTVPFKLGDCVPVGTKFGTTLASEDHHLHIELKAKPVETNPIQLANSCGAAEKCWGYTTPLPESLGYADPLPKVFAAVSSAPSARFVPTQTYSFRASPARNEYQRTSERTFGNATIGSTYDVLQTVASPNASICAGDWYRVKKTPTPDCFRADQCFQHDATSRAALGEPDKWAESIAGAWICGDGGNAQVVIADGDFAAWTPFYLVTDDPYTATPGPGTSSGSTNRAASGGYPDAYLVATHTYFTGDTIWTGAIKSDFAYSPASDGPIVSVTVRADLTMRTAGASAWQLVIEQDGRRFFSVPFQAFSGAWSTVTATSLASENFDTNPWASNTGIAPDGNRPDFTGTGKPMKFGLLIGNRLIGSGSATSTHGIDNFALTISR